MKKPIQNHIIACKGCGVEKQASISVTGYTCSDCVIEMWDPADEPKTKKPSGYLPGWKFMKLFVHANGSVYHRGIEQLELKGTLPSTPIPVKTAVVKKSKIQKATEKQEALNEFAKLKKQLNKELRITYRKKLESRLKQLQKLIK